MKKSSIEAVKKQWFTSIILILFAVWIVINPAGGLMRQMILIFLLFFSQDETNVFFNIDLESKFYFYVQCVVMCVISFFYAVIVQMDHGSLSFDKVKIVFGILQIINIILRMIMTYVLIEEEEYRMKIYKSSSWMLILFVLCTALQLSLIHIWRCRRRG